MFDLIDGLPLHPLVVHAVVVLLPLAVVGAVAIALRPAWRRSYGPLVVGASAVATALVPLATASGGELEMRVGDPGRHAALGDQLIWFALPLFALTLLLVVLDRRGQRPSTSGATVARQWPLRVVVVLAILAALAAAAQVYRVGESGARATWSGDVASAQTGRR